MIPVLTYPLALLGLLSIPAFVAIYFFRNKFHARTVSSLLFWEDLLRAREGGSRITRLQLPLLFFLELLAIVLLVLAAADPRRPAAGSRPLLIAVLDDSASMSARGAGGTARDRAAAALMREYERGGFRALRLILAGVEPRILGEPLARPADIRRALDAWRCRAPSAALDAGVALALEIGGQHGRLLVLTDRPPAAPPQPGRIQWAAVGAPLPNVAIVNAARTRGAALDRCFLEVANFSSDPAQTQLLMEHGGERALDLAAGETRKIVLEVPSDLPDLRLRLAADALAADNEARLLATPERRVRAAIRFAQPETQALVTRAVEATGMRSSVEARPQIIFTDGTEPENVEPDTWIARMPRPAAAQAYAGPFVLDLSHPLTAGLNLDAVIWGADPEAPAAGIPVIMAGNVPLVTVEDRSALARSVTIRFVPELSTLQDTPNWPALVWNLLHWRRGSLPGLDTVNARLGGRALLTTREETPAVTLLDPDGRTRRLPVLRRQSVIPAEVAGLHSVQEGPSVHALSVNFLSPAESDLSACRTGRWGGWTDAESLRRDHVSVAWIFLLLALLVLGIHLVMATRGSENAGFGRKARTP